MKTEKNPEIELGNSYIFFIRRYNLNEFVIFENLKKFYKPYFRSDINYNFGQIIIQYDEDNNIINSDSIDIITGYQVYDKDHYIFYIMDINCWLDKRLSQVVDDILLYGLDNYRKEMQDLRILHNQINLTNNRELNEKYIRDYFNEK